MKRRNIAVPNVRVGIWGNNTAYMMHSLYHTNRNDFFAVCVDSQQARCPDPCTHLQFMASSNVSHKFQRLVEKHMVLYDFLLKRKDDAYYNRCPA